MHTEPRRRQVVPPTPHERAEQEQRTATWRAELDARREAERPVLRALLQTMADLGLGVRDVEAAMDCRCGCHPRVSLDAHAGAGCSCQLSPAERAANRRAWLDSWAALREGREPNTTAADVAARATELGATARLVGWACPFVIVGVVDGRAFYLRERHEVWAVTIADADDPLRDPWTAPPEVVTWDIADGSDEDFMVDGRFSAVRATETAVDAVRSHLRRSTCRHTAAAPDHRYCPACGRARGSAGSP